MRMVLPIRFTNILRSIPWPYLSKSRTDTAWSVLRTKTCIFQYFHSVKYSPYISCQNFEKSRFCSTISKFNHDSDSVISSSIHIENLPPEISFDKNGNLVLKGWPIFSLEQHTLEAVTEKFNLMKLTVHSFGSHGVQVGIDGNTLYFPLVDINGNMVAVRVLTYEADAGVLNDRIFPRETTTAVFGWSPAIQKRSKVIITYSCLDAMAINQELNIPAVAVYFENKDFPLEILKFFEQFEKIYVWFNSNNKQNWRLHKAFTERYEKSSFLIRPDGNPSTPLSCLQNEHNLSHILSKAFPLKHNTVETFSSFRDAAYSEFKDYGKCSGYKWQRYPVLNELLKGLRRGELTVFSGQTGTGKTTFMSEYSLDLCMQGVPTLWGSFEISNPRLLKTMLTQFSLCSLKDNVEKFQYWATEFDKLPIFFMNFNGHHSIEHVIDAMKHAVLVYFIEHIVIDNLQFMMNVESFNSSVDLLRRQDQIFAAFRNFACQHNCHVTLVMHPRKEPEFTELSNASISGSAKATQEADNILFLQTTKHRQYLQVTKNRFDGEKGCVQLEFDKNTLTFTIKKIMQRGLTKPDTL